MKFGIYAVMLCLGATLVCPPAVATPITPASVVCSGSWGFNGFPGDGDGYGCAGLIDGVVNDNLQGGKGGVSASYWLGRDRQPNETFTVDLGGDFKIAALDLYNTHNRTNNDRGTSHFQVWISSAPVTPDTSSTSFGTLILEGDLAFFPFVDLTTPNPVQSFDIADTTGRYVTFRAVGAGLPNGFGSGLSEIVIQSVPEPGTLALLALGIAGIGYSRRKQS